MVFIIGILADTDDLFSFDCNLNPDRRARMELRPAGSTATHASFLLLDGLAI
jgi:hypothetical protein